MPIVRGSKWLRERFPVGARVHLTPDGVREGLYGNEFLEGRFGMVTGYGCNKDHTERAVHILVRRDHVRTAKRYHVKFWEPLEVPKVEAATC